MYRFAVKTLDLPAEGSLSGLSRPMGPGAGTVLLTWSLQALAGAAAGSPMKQQASPSAGA